MPFDEAVRLTEIMLGLAFIQQSLEHLHAPADERRLFLPRLMLSILLVLGFYTPWVSVALVLLGLLLLKRFQGPYNGGSDRMGLLVLCGLCAQYFMPNPRGQEIMFGYIALQLILSYCIAGWVKLANPEWRNGHALRDVFLFSAYPASESLRAWASKPRLVWAMSWAVMLFELLFPFSLLTQQTLIAGLVVAACFHLANACLFGFNRFFWVWLAAYPSLFWLQQRVLL